MSCCLRDKLVRIVAVFEAELEGLVVFAAETPGNIVRELFFENIEQFIWQTTRFSVEESLEGLTKTFRIAAVGLVSVVEKVEGREKEAVRFAD